MQSTLHPLLSCLVLFVEMAYMMTWCVFTTCLYIPTSLQRSGTGLACLWGMPVPNASAPHSQLDSVPEGAHWLRKCLCQLCYPISFCEMDLLILTLLNIMNIKLMGSALRTIWHVKNIIADITQCIFHCSAILSTNVWQAYQTCFHWQTRGQGNEKKRDHISSIFA